MDTRKEYKMAFRAMRKWWKMVDSGTASPSEEYNHYNSIRFSYESDVLNAALESLRVRRNAEYAAQHSELSHLKTIKHVPFSAENLPR